MRKVGKATGEYDLTKTPDTGGYFNTAYLMGGASLPVANNAPGGKAAIQGLLAWFPPERGATVQDARAAQAWLESLTVVHSG